MPVHFLPAFLALLTLFGAFPRALCAAETAPPPLPDSDATVEIDAQEWPLRPGPRKVAVHLRYPGGRLADVTESTGLFLSLHNWGGTGFAGTADPAKLVSRYDVVAVGVDYLQSGPELSIEGPEPYDFGYLQALDALRALHFVFAGLRERGIPFAEGRLYVTGGSGGGNVTLMANKLAPRTFAVAIDLCGMARLTDDIAFNLPGGSDLDARYRPDAADPYYLSPDAQELRFVGQPRHLETMRQLGNACHLVVVHGTDDTTCPFADAEMAANFDAAGLNVETRFLTAGDLDGQVFTSTSHALGNRTEIVDHVAGDYLRPDSPKQKVRQDPCDFDLRDEQVRYETPGGAWVISYQRGYPVGRFEAR